MSPFQKVCWRHFLILDHSIPIEVPTRFNFLFSQVRLLIEEPFVSLANQNNVKDTLLQNGPTFVAQTCAQLYLFSFYGGDDFVDSQIFARKSIPKTYFELKKLFCCIEFIKVVLIPAYTVKQLLTTVSQRFTI